MNGYFQRLIARAIGEGLAVRPLSNQPHTIPLNGKPFAAREELPTDVPRLLDGAQASALNVPSNGWSAAKAVEKADAVDVSPGAVDVSQPALHTDTSRVVENRTTSVSITAADSSKKRSHQSLPASERAQVVDEDEVSMISGAPASRPAKTAQPSYPVTTRQSNRQQTPWGGLPRQTDTEQRNNKRSEQEQHTVQVTIGRVEIRATVASTPTRKTPVKSSAMSLDEYLKRRNGNQG